MVWLNCSDCAQFDPISGFCSQIQYADFDSNFYEEHADIALLSKSHVDTLRNKLGIKVCKLAYLFKSFQLVPSGREFHAKQFPSKSLS